MMARFFSMELTNDHSTIESLVENKKQKREIEGVDVGRVY